MSGSGSSKPFALVAVTAASIFAVIATAPLAKASKTAEAVADVSAIVAAKDALIGSVCAVVPEPVLTKSVAATFFIKGAIFGLISVGARIYDKTVDKKGSTPRQVLSASPIGVGISTLGGGGVPVIAGFSPVTVDPEAGTLNISDHHIEGAPPCGVIALLGSGFSQQLADNFVLFDTTAATPLGFADLGNGAQALFIAVPSTAELSKQHITMVRVNTDRVLSDPVQFRIEAAPHSAGPGSVTQTFLAKTRVFLSQLIALDWEHLIDAEAASQGITLSSFDRNVALEAAHVIVGRAQEGLETVHDLESALTSSDISLLDPLLQASIVIEALDVGINLTSH